MSGWTPPDFTTFTDLMSDGSPIDLDGLSPTHRRTNVGSSPHPRVLYPSAPPPGPYGPYAPPPGPYGSYPPPPYPYPQPPSNAPPTDSGTVPPYPPPYGSYPPPPYGSYPPPPYGPYPPAPSEAPAPSSESNAVEPIAPTRAKRLDWTVPEEEKLVNAWLFHSNDSIAGNCKTGTSFWGQIAETFNSTSDPSRHRTSKQLKDHWNVYNKEVSLFNAYHIQETNMRQSGADDAMVMKAAMERYANDKRVTQPFRKHHWWDAGLVKAKLFKQWNKMRDRPTADMTEAEKRKHAKAIKMVETELGLDDDNEEEEEEQEAEE
ncbi:hypothetical protein QYE76_051201 [Lolium multiflorum]|uniref:Myb-like domain-containing protein n=1 Tax=Lolium multiflorum TaxID=4521 RepID=A0AAD8SRE9_LOLMU|nr:hypothetical protein QYE76_051201 [Lolium multiflorum]